MSRLDELIKQFCPDGVECKTLEDIATYRRGSFPQPYGRPQWYGGEDAMPFVQVADVREDFKLVEDTKQKISKLAQPKSIFVPKDSVIVTLQGTIGRVAITQYDSYVDRTLAIFEDYKIEINKKFFAYVLKQKFDIEKKHARGSTLKTITKEEFSKFPIPVPPMPVQEEIVHILDSFTQLTAELTADLTARKKKYEYYRDELLTFGDDVERKKIGDVATVTKLAGFEFTKFVRYSNAGNIIALRGLNIKNGTIDLSDVKYIDNSDLSKLNRSKLHIGDMLFTYVGTIGQVAIIDKEDKYYLAPNVALIRSTYKNILPEYMKYYFQSNQFWQTQINRLLQSSSMKNIPMEKIRKFELPIPPLEEQKRIVDILDRFDKLCNDISEGLPAEIEARQKQYEYYRDKLLTFKEKTA